jgi:hypothetical protein
MHGGRLAKPPSEKELEAWDRERADYGAYLNIWTAAQRREEDISDFRRHQLRKRVDCALCRRPSASRTGRRDGPLATTLRGP